MTAVRHRLPNRRPSETVEIEIEGQTFAVTLGFDPADGSVLEVFISGSKPGSQRDAELDDAAILLSRCLQAGMTAAEMWTSMSRLPTAYDKPATEPASAIGAALRLIVGLERERGR